MNVNLYRVSAETLDGKHSADYLTLAASTEEAARLAPEMFDVVRVRLLDLPAVLVDGRLAQHPHPAPRQT